MRLDLREDWDTLARWFAGPVSARPTDECGLVRCEPGWSWQVGLRDHDLWLVVDGHGSGVIDGTRYDLSPGDLLHLPPGSRGRVVQDPHRRFTIAYCHYDWWDTGGDRRAELPEQLRSAAHLQLHDPVAVQDPLTTVIRLSRSRQPLASAQRSALLELVLVEVYRQQAAAAGVPTARIDPRIDQVVADLRAAPSTRLTLAEAAQRAGMSPQYFSRTFTAQVGLSFRDFIMANRLDRARTLLAETTMTVGEVARALGYADTYLFSRQVSARFGQPPSRLRSASVR